MLFLQLTSLSEGDREALGYILKAAIVIDDIFYEQVTSSSNAFKILFILLLFGWMHPMSITCKRYIHWIDIFCIVYSFVLQPLTTLILN